MCYEFIQIIQENRIAWLEYNHPPINAINWQMLREIAQAFDQLVDDTDVRVIVFASGLDQYFSSGADLRVLQSMEPAEMAEWVTLCHRLVQRMRVSCKPLLAAIHGTAVGGGLEMVLNCDIRYAASDAKLGQPEINIGFIPPVGTTQSLARLLGRSRALRFLYDGTLVSADEALTMGLVDWVVPAEQLREQVQSYAAGLTRKPAEALAAIRRCITLGSELPYEDGLALELEEAVRLSATADFSEGLSAFLEKRQPRWE